MTTLTSPSQLRPTPARSGPVLRTSPRCPTCARPDVVTFRAFLPTGGPLTGTPPVVCIQCAPRPPRS